MNLLRFLKNIYGKKIYFQIIFIILLAFGTAVAQFEATQHLGDVIDAVGKGYEKAVYQFLVISASTVLYILGTAAFTFWGGKITAAFSRCVHATACHAQTTIIPIHAELGFDKILLLRASEPIIVPIAGRI